MAAAARRLLRLLLFHVVLYHATCAAAAPEWHKLLYTKAADGYDDHDAVNCVAPSGATRPVGEHSAACAVLDGKIQLRGCVQCSVNLVSCWDKPMAHFATLPPGCQPPKSGTIKQPDQMPTGAAISVDSDGKLVLLKASPSTWNMVLDGVAVPMASRWGWTFLLIVFLGAAFYSGGGIAYNHKTKQMPLDKDAFPHKEHWVFVGGLVVDGARFSWAQSRARYLEARGLPTDPAVPLLGGSAAVEPAPVPTARARPSPGRSDKTPKEVMEERDGSVHSSKQKIKVVVARKEDGHEEEEDEDELVE
jgi:hypothetical protein